MALTDPQVHRYARQILLREVGGRGQEKLLSTPVRVVGDGPALQAALTYLVAGGSPVEAQQALHGFLEGTTLAAYSDDSTPRAAAAVCLSAAPAPGDGEVRVTVGEDGVAFCPAGACVACFEATAGTLRPDGPAARAVMIGALAALMVQRLVLAPSGTPVGLIRWENGRLASREALRCPAHRQA